ncbi:MAG: TonB-dependent receptor [Chitinophagales bacterium]|nr:TonB-dependent receptor [Chitinophagales bacterium]
MKQLCTTILLCLMVVAGAYAQRTISGTVTDQSGEALIGATVAVKNTSVGAVTDVDGRYTIQVAKSDAILMFSYTGYATQEIAVGAGSVVDVTLVENANVMDEVVVIGYGKQIRSTLTGNIAKVNNENIKGMPVVSVEQAMQGQAAGVNIETVNGKVGAAARVRVRGVGSINAGTEPLFVVDGIPLSKDSRNTYGAGLNPLADINFNDIESIEVLKDASAKAIYGSRGSNGVVLITTKSGKSGKSQIELDLQYGFSQPTRKREFLNAAEYVELFTEAANNSDDIDGYAYDDPDSWTTFVQGRFFRYSGRNDDWMSKIDKTNWQDEAFQDASLYNANLSFSGGSDKMRYYFSANHGLNEGILVANHLTKDGARLNLDFSATDKLKMGVNLSVSRTNTRTVSDDNAFSTPMQLVALAPITPKRDENGELYDRPVTTYYNGLIDVEDATRKVYSNRTLVNVYGDYSFTQHLALRVEGAANLYNVRDEARFGVRTDAGNASNGFGESVFAGATDYNTNAVLRWNKTFDKNDLGFDLGTEYFESTNNRTSVFGEQFPTDELKTLASAAIITGGTSTEEQYSFLSYFGRARYNFDRKYLLNASARVDGSSRFGDNKRYAFFPAFSAGWVLSEEAVLQDNPTISFLKLRASWGQSGNADIGNFRALGLYAPGSYNGQSNYVPEQIANPDLTWEKSTEVDFGLDWGLFDNRLNGEIDYYIKNTNDLLQQVPIPATTGYKTQWRNIGELENRGWEFTVNSNNLVGEFKWTTSLNLALNKNKVVALADGQDIIDDGGTRYANVVKVGEPIGVFYGAEYAGVDPANGDAIWYTNATDGSDPRATTNDFSEANYVVLGSPLPDLIGGISNSFSWKGVSLDIRFQGQYGNEIHRSGDVFMSCNACWFDNQTRDQLDRWQNPGDVTNVPEARLGYSNGDIGRSSRYISDGSYLRLKNITLAYDVPTKWMRGVRSLRVYATATNLLTFTNYEGWDPEVTTDFLAGNTVYGIDFYSAPQPKTIIGGIRIGF